MPKRELPNDNGLPVLVIDAQPENKEPKIKYLRLGGIPVGLAKISAYRNDLKGDYPNRHFPSLFGPGGISRGYSDSSRI